MDVLCMAGEETTATVQRVAAATQLAVRVVLTTAEALQLLRVVRLTRVVRIFKMSKNFQGLMVLGRTLHRSMTAITLLLTFVITLITIFATLIFQFEAGEWKEHADL